MVWHMNRAEWRSATAAILAVACVWPCRPGAAAERPPVLAIRTGPGGQPMLLDSSYGYIGGFNPGQRSSGKLTVNSDTGTIYGFDNDGYGNEIARIDPAREYDKGGPAIEGGMGTTRTYNIAGYLYAGTVAGDVTAQNNSPAALSYDPHLDTGSHTGVVVGGSTGGTPTWKEYISQTGTESLGQLNEGTVATPHHTSALVCFTSLQDRINDLGGAGHWGNHLLVDAAKGQFTPINDTAGSFPAHRYFMFGPGGYRWLIVLHVKAQRETEPTVTTWGTRYAYKRNRADADCILMDHAAFANLVVNVNDDIAGVTQDPVSGNIFLLTYTSGPDQAYLSAIRPTIPDDSTQSMSYEIVDLDSESDNKHLALNTVHPDLAHAAGIAFNADGSILYVSVMSTGGGAVRAVYALDRTTAPLPDTLIQVR